MALIKKTRELDKLLTPEETAQILGLDAKTLQIWRTTRRYPLKFVKVGRLVRYRLEDITTFIESRTISPHNSVTKNAITKGL